jgi:hypothetical protein
MDWCLQEAMSGALVVVGMWFPCGEPVDRVALVEVTYGTFVPEGLSFGVRSCVVWPDSRPFLQGVGVRPLAARSRKKRPASTSQLDVSLPMSARHPAHATRVGKLFHKASWAGTTARVSRDEAPAFTALLSCSPSPSFSGLLSCSGDRPVGRRGGRVSRDEASPEGGVSLPMTGTLTGAEPGAGDPCLSRQSLAEWTLEERLRAKGALAWT